MHGEQAVYSLTKFFLQDISSQAVRFIRELQCKIYFLQIVSSSFKVFLAHVICM